MTMTEQPPPSPEPRMDTNPTVGQIYGWSLTPQRILLALAVLCFAIAFLGGIDGINIVALGLALGFAAFLF